MRFVGVTSLTTGTLAVALMSSAAGRPATSWTSRAPACAARSESERQMPMPVARMATGLVQVLTLEASVHRNDVSSVFVFSAGEEGTVYTSFVLIIF